MDVTILCSVFVAVMTAHKIMSKNASTGSKRTKWFNTNAIGTLLALEYAPVLAFHDLRSRLASSRRESIIGGLGKGMSHLVASVGLAALWCVTLYAQQPQPSQQARDCLQAAERQFTNAGYTHDNASLSSHYNSRLGRCFAEFATTKFEDAHWEFVREVVDAANGAIVAQITWIHGTMLMGANTTMCRVVTPSGVALNCRRLYEFEEIVKDQYGIE